MHNIGAVTAVMADALLKDTPNTVVLPQFRTREMHMRRACLKTAVHRSTPQYSSFDAKNVIKYMEK